ncbi:MAG: TonB family protein [Bacteroidota bacterium]
MKQTKFFALLYLLMSCLNLAVAQSNSDQTESPYFYLPCEDCPKASFPLLHTEANVTIAGVIADVKVTQVYKNDSDQAIEAIYVFPASTRAAVYHMEFSIGERKIVAKIEEKGKARQDYEQAKQDGKRATLLEQHRPNVFQMNVANIMPGDRVEVCLKYTETLIPEEGTYEFVYPTVVGPRYAGESDQNLLASNEEWVSNPYLAEGSKTPYTFNLNLGLKAGLPIQQMQSKTHRVKINYTGAATAQLSLDPSEKEGGNRDFILQYRLKGKSIENGLLVYEGEKENYFMMMVQPPERIQKKEIAPREYLFIVDISGSMYGFPLETSKALLKDLIGQLRPSDRFNVMLFAGTAAFLSEASIAANSANIDRAIHFIRRQRGSGGTNLLNAIHRAMAVPKTDGFSRSFVIATDGYVSVEAEAFDYIRDHLNKANFFSFGIGSSVNRHLIEGLARVGGGAPFVVTNQKEAPALAAKFRRYIESPLLTDIQLDFDSQNIYDITPSRIPDLMGERPLVVFGKYRKKGTIRLTGNTPGGAFERTMDLRQASTTNESKALSNLWARHRIQQLGDYTNLRSCPNREDLVQAITQLGLTHNLLTEYTSFIAIDSEVVNQSGKLNSVKQPLPLPQGVPNSAVGRSNKHKQAYSGGHYQRKKQLNDARSWSTPRPTGPELAEEMAPPPPPPPPAEPEVEEIFSVVEEMPRFPGCEEISGAERKACANRKMLTFLYKNLKYPTSVKDLHITGTSVVRFLIDKEGNIKEIKMARSLHPDFDQEIIRVIKLMPKWIPGKQMGKPVDVWFNLPVNLEIR